MSDMTAGINTIPSGAGIGNIALAPVTYSTPAPSSGGFWNFMGNAASIAGALAPTAVQVYGMATGKPAAPAPTYNVTLGGALSNQAPATSSLAPFGNIGNALSYADEWLSQSKTLNQATTNVGTGVGTSLSSIISEYKNVLILGVVAIVGFFIFKSLNKK